MILEAAEFSGKLAQAFWQWGLGAVLSLLVGVVFVIWPRRSNDVLHKITQSMRPYRVPKPADALTFFAGWVFLLVGVVFAYETWSQVQ